MAFFVLSRLILVKYLAYALSSRGCRKVATASLALQLTSMSPEMNASFYSVIEIQVLSLLHT